MRLTGIGLAFTILMSLSAASIDEHSAFCREKYSTLSASVSTAEIMLSKSSSYNKDGQSTVIKYLWEFRIIDYIFDNMLPTALWMGIAMLIGISFMGCGIAYFIKLCEKEKLIISPLDERKAVKEAAKLEKALLKEEERKNAKKKPREEESEEEDSEDEEEDNEQIEGVGGVPYSPSTIASVKGDSLITLIAIKSVFMLLLLGALGYGYTLLDTVL